MTEMAGRTLSQAFALLLRDRFVKAALVVFALTTSVRLMPFVDIAGRELMTSRYAPFVFLCLIVTVLRRRLHALPAAERSFWNDLTIAYIFWLTSAAIFLFFPAETKPLPIRFLSEGLFTLYYVSFILALERQPHRRSRWREAGLERLLTWPSVIVFVSSLVFYFMAVPLLRDRWEYNSYVSSMCFYVALDFVLFVKLIYSALTADLLRWRAIYSALALGLGLISLTDLGETLMAYRPDLSFWSAPWSFLYDLAYVVVIAAVRLRHIHVAKEGETGHAAEDRMESGLPGPSGQTMVSAMAFPFIHFSVYFFELLGASGQPLREIVVGWTLLALGAITYLQYRLLEHRTQLLWQDHAKAMESLRNSEHDLRLMVERKHTHELINASEERFFKVFYSKLFSTGSQETMLDRADAAVIAVNTSHTITYWNAAAADLFGRSAHSAVGQTWLELFGQPLRPSSGTLTSEVLVLRRDSGTMLRITLCRVPVDVPNASWLIFSGMEPHEQAPPNP